MISNCIASESVLINLGKIHFFLLGTALLQIKYLVFILDIIKNNENKLGLTIAN